MAKPGRKPKPPEIKRAEGNPGGRPIPGQPDFHPLENVAPAWLDLAAKAIWERLVGELAPLRTHRELDRDALAAYCQAAAHMSAAQSAIEEKGLTTDEGKKRAEWYIFKDCVGLVTALSRELGISTSERARGTLSVAEEVDEIAAMYDL